MITVRSDPRFCLRFSMLSIDVSLHVSFSMGRVCTVLVWALFTVSLFFHMNKSMKSHPFYCCKWSATYVTKYVLLTFYDKSEKKKVNRSTSSTGSLQRLWDGISNWSAGYERVIFCYSPCTLLMCFFKDELERHFRWQCSQVKIFVFPSDVSLCCTTRWNFNPSKSLYVLSHFSHE